MQVSLDLVRCEEVDSAQRDVAGGLHERKLKRVMRDHQQAPARVHVANVEWENVDVPTCGAVYHAGEPFALGLELEAIAKAAPWPAAAYAPRPVAPCESEQARHVFCSDKDVLVDVVWNQVGITVGAEERATSEHEWDTMTVADVLEGEQRSPGTFAQGLLGSSSIEPRVRMCRKCGASLLTAEPCKAYDTENNDAKYEADRRTAEAYGAMCTPPPHAANGVAFCLITTWIGL